MYFTDFFFGDTDRDTLATPIGKCPATCTKQLQHVQAGQCPMPAYVQTCDSGVDHMTTMLGDMLVWCSR